MALTKCPECGKENVSDSAEACPDCGYAIKVHFKKIRFAEEQKERELRIADEKRRAELEAKRQEEERIKSVPKPSKPKVSILGLIIGILVIWIGGSQASTPEWKRQRSMDRGNGDPVFYGWLFIIIGISIVCFLLYLLYKRMERYNLAQTDFEAYQKQVIKELDEVALAAMRSAEAQANAPKCPMCNSTNLERISTLNRATSVAMVGVASGKIGKQYKCKKCKNMW